MGPGRKPWRKFFGSGGLGNPQEPAVVVTKAYDCVLWLLPKVERFPRSYRFSVGDRLVSSGLDLLLNLVQSAYASDKASLLHTASVNTNMLRYLLRLAKDLRLLTVDSYGLAAERGEFFAQHVR